MIKKEDILDIELKENYEEFCNSQKNCNECILLKKDLISNGYDESCEQVYDLLRIIQKEINIEENVTRLTVDLSDSEIQMISYLIYKYEPNRAKTSKKIVEAYMNGETVKLRGVSVNES